MEKHIKVIILQLTRIGDILQTMQMVNQARQEYPNLEVSIVTRKKFSSGIKFLLEKTFNNIYEIEVLSLFENKKDLASGRAQLNNLCKEINKQQYDLSINLSFNKSSSYLNSLINAKTKMGLFRNALGELAVYDKWSQYIYSTVMTGPQNPFNLVEIYRNILGVKSFKAQNVKKEINDTIIVHPFASHKKKKWHVSKWFETIYTLSKKHPTSKIIIVGNDEDSKEQYKLLDYSSFAEIQDKVEFGAGKLSIEEVYNKLKNAKLFIGHDSMVSHLAAITDTPSIIVSLGTVRPAETTPFHDKVINIVPKSKCYPCALETNCSLYSCHSDINHQVVVGIANIILQDKEISKETLFENISTFHLDSCKLYYAQINKAGNFNLVNFTDDYMSYNETIHSFYKLIWSLYFKDEEIFVNTPQITKATAAQLLENLNGLQYLFELFNFGAKYSKQLVEESKKSDCNSEIVTSLISKLSEIDRLCDVTKKTYNLTASLIDYFYVAKANAKGNGLREIAENYLVLFHDSLNICAMLYELVENTVKPFHQEAELNLDNN